MCYLCCDGEKTDPIWFEVEVGFVDVITDEWIAPRAAI